MKNIYSLFILFLVFTVTVKAQVSEQEFQALKALYNATGGDNWTDRTGWENINTTATKDDVTTAWFGIPSISEGHILGINFTNNNLIGSIPSEFGNMTWLRQLNLSTNKLTGLLPSVFGNFTDLTLLAVGGNQFTGPIPASWATLVNLTELLILNNSFNIPFPSAVLTYFPKLQKFYFYNCGFSGELPDLFENTPDLREINATTNSLNGVIPASLSKLTKLRNLYLGGNAFTGNLPSLDSCKNIEQIYLENNSFTGSIPESYNQLNSLWTLDLRKNNLSGLIPDDIYSNLHTLYLENNYISFEGLEPVISKILNVDTKNYSTQKLFPVTTNSLSLNQGEALTLNATTLSVYNLGGNNNRYKWFRNNVEVYSGNSPIYSVPAATAINAGIYRFEVTNTVVTNMTLKSDNFTVSVVGSNHVPSNITLSPSTIDESFTGTVGTLTATDTDTADTHIFTLATGNGTNDKENRYFSIVGNQLVFASSWNYEYKTTLNIFVSVNDGNGGIFTKAFVITVNNIDEAPEYKDQLTTVTIDETTPNGSKVVDLTASDPEGNPVTYSIEGGNGAGAFGISGNQLIVADNSKFSYDAVNSYSLTVRASDGNLTKDVLLTVNLNRINALPEVNNATFALDENSAAGTLVGTITASDPEGEALTYSIIAGNGLSAFGLSGNTLSVANSVPLDFETNPVFDLVINVTDGSSNVQAHIIINLNNVAESTDHDLLTFSVPGLVGDAVIDALAHTVRIYVSNVDLRSLTADFTLSSNATSDPASGSVLNFTTPQTITVTAQSGNTQQWIVTVTFRTGNDELNNSNVRLYPNPASNYLNISGLEVGSLVKIITLSGQTILSKIVSARDESINVGHLINGNYLLLIENQSGKSVRKFVRN